MKLFSQLRIWGKFIKNFILDRKELKHAVCALMINKEGKILCVSRKTDPNDFGLPGGKVDGEESLGEALCREIREETGYCIINAKPIFCMNDCGYMTTTFLCESWEGEPSTKESGVLAWKTWDELCSQGSFIIYNRELREVWEQHKLNQ